MELLAFPGAYEDNLENYPAGDRVLMAMIVVCESCRSRFRLNESLLKESDAIRFRCRKCGGPIMVRNPCALPDIPVAAVSANIVPPMAADISSAVQPGIEQAIPAAQAPAHGISGEPPAPRKRGNPETPLIGDAEEAAIVLPDALENPLSPPAPRRNVRRRSITVAPSSNPMVMILISVLGTAIGCLCIYFLILGLTPPPRWLSFLLQLR